MDTAQPASGPDRDSSPDIQSTRPSQLAGLDALVFELYQRSGATQFGISQDIFAAILNEVAQKNLAPEDGQSAARELLAGLRLEELMLARACAAGNEAAWETFLLRYREPLYDIAHAIAKDDSIARELADSLFSDLYGSQTPAGNRVSKLNSYTGTGSLQGWIRAVMAQSFINIYRSQRRLVSLEEETQDVELAAPAAEPTVSVDARLEQATDDALGSLPAEDRFILAAYFLDGRTLAEIARTLKVHESTISRRVEKIVAGVRKKIRDGLVRRGMSRAQADEALEADVRDVAVDVRARLQESLQETRNQPFSTQRAGKAAGKGPH
jgi:RNA polymerase sigma-70 factor (ECF subfamily)